MIPKIMPPGLGPMGGNRFSEKIVLKQNAMKQLENSASGGHGTRMAHGDRAPLRG
jgi:hypothetical protein